MRLHMYGKRERERSPNDKKTYNEPDKYSPFGKHRL